MLTWVATIGLSAVLLGASLQCWRDGRRWGSHSGVLFWQAQLALGWLAAACLAAVCWPLGVVLAAALWRDRSVTSRAVLTWGAAGGIWVLVTALPPASADWLLTAYVASALGQCGVVGWQITRCWRRRAALTYHDWRIALHGSMGNRFFLGLLCAQALPLAPAWAMPILVGGLLASSATSAALAAGAGWLVAYPATWPWLLLAGAVGAVWMAGMRKGWRNVRAWHPRMFGDTLRARLTLWWLIAHRWTRRPWRPRLIGDGHDAFSTQARWWHTIRAVRGRHQGAGNDAVQGLLEVGAVGVAVLVWLVGSTLLTHGRVGDPLTGAVVAVAVGSLMQFPLHVPHTALPALILTALLAAR